MHTPIVVLTPVKNEEWILDNYIQVTSNFADLIIIADQFSSDKSREIASNYDKVLLIKNPKKHLEVLIRLNSFMKKQGWPITNIVPSPITGQKGNREFLIHCPGKVNSKIIEDDHIRNMINI